MVSNPPNPDIPDLSNPRPIVGRKHSNTAKEHESKKLITTDSMRNKNRENAHDKKADLVKQARGKRSKE